MAMSKKRKVEAAACWRMLKTIIRNVVAFAILGVVNFAYLFWGAKLFAILEENIDATQTLAVATSTRVLAKNIIALTPKGTNCPDGRPRRREEDISRVMADHEAIQEDFYRKKAITRVNSTSRPWDKEGSMIYVFQVVSTIGWGNITPKTWEGKIGTIVYSIFGIPLFYTLSTYVTDYINRILIGGGNIFIFLWGTWCYCLRCNATQSDNAEDDSSTSATEEDENVNKPAKPHLGQGDSTQNKSEPWEMPVYNFTKKDVDKVVKIFRDSDFDEVLTFMSSYGFSREDLLVGLPEEDNWQDSGQESEDDIDRMKAMSGILFRDEQKSRSCLTKRHNSSPRTFSEFDVTRNNIRCDSDGAFQNVHQNFRRNDYSNVDGYAKYDKRIGNIDVFKRFDNNEKSNQNKTKTARDKSEKRLHQISSRNVNICPDEKINIKKRGHVESCKSNKLEMEVKNERENYEAEKPIFPAAHVVNDQTNQSYRRSSDRSLDRDENSPDKNDDLPSKRYRHRRRIQSGDITYRKYQGKCLVTNETVLHTNQPECNQVRIAEWSGRVKPEVIANKNVHTTRRRKVNDEKCGLPPTESVTKGDTPEFAIRSDLTKQCVAFSKRSSNVSPVKHSTEIIPMQNKPAREERKEVNYRKSDERKNRETNSNISCAFKKRNNFNNSADLAVDYFDIDDMDLLEKETNDNSLPLMINLILLFGYISLGAAVFVKWNVLDPDSDQTSGLKWVDAIYFIYITFSTIGFGDILPNKDLFWLSFTLLYGFFGLAAYNQLIGNALAVIDVFFERLFVLLRIAEIVKEEEEGENE